MKRKIRFSRKVMSTSLVFCLLLSVIPMAVFATGDVPEYSGGTGTENDPYLLSTAADLIALKDFVINGGADDTDAVDSCGLGAYHGYYFKMVKDIDMTGMEWTPFNFNGTFDGAGHTISNMQMNQNFFESADPTNNEYKSAEYEAGFFGQVVHATIKNLYFENCTAKVSDGLDPASSRDIYVGIVATTAIASCFENVSAVNCSVIQNGEDDNFAYSGGLVGYADICHFSSCSFDGSITIGGDATSSQYVGGIVGCLSDYYNEFITDYDNPYNMVVGAGEDFGIYNCLSTAVINCPQYYAAAGIAGTSGTDFMSAVYENCAFGGKITAGGRACGIVGDGDRDDTFKNCVVYAESIAGTNVYAIGMNSENIFDCKISDVTAISGTTLTELNGLTAETLSTDGEKIADFKSNLYGKLADGAENVSVTLSKNGVVKYTAVTNADGEYNFGKQLLRGEYTLSIAETSDKKAYTDSIAINYATNHKYNIDRTAKLEGEIRIHDIDLVNGDDDHTLALGEGTAAYDPETRTLTLTNAEITQYSSTSRKAGIYINGFTNHITIKLVGENSITLTDTQYDCNGIWNDSKTALIINGTGSLDVLTYNNYSPFGIWNRYDDLLIRDVTLNFKLAEGSKDNGWLVDCDGRISLDNAVLTASDYMQGLFGVAGVIITNGSYVTLNNILENGINSEDDITIEDSSVNITALNFAGICCWGDLDVKESELHIASEYDNAIYCYGHIKVSGGKAFLTSIDNDAFRANGGITITDEADITAEGNGAGIYTNEVLDVQSGTVIAKGGIYAILATRISGNDVSTKPSGEPEAIVIGAGLTEENGYAVKTEDWEVRSVWDDSDWEYYDKWQSRSYYVDGDGDKMLEISIVAIEDVTIAENTKNTTVTYDGSAIDLSTLFIIDENAGAATYTVTNGTGEGTVADGKLIVTKAGTFTVKIDTAPVGKYAAGTLTVTLTVYTEASAMAPGEPETPDESPQTGDNRNIVLWLALLFISGSSVITLTVYNRKRRNKI